MEEVWDSFYVLSEDRNKVIGLLNSSTRLKMAVKRYKLSYCSLSEFYTSRASNFVLETKDEVERFKNLVRSYNSVDNAYKLTIRNLNDLYLKRENTKEWQDRVDELNDEAKRLSENYKLIKFFNFISVF